MQKGRQYNGKRHSDESAHQLLSVNQPIIDLVHVENMLARQHPNFISNRKFFQTDCAFSLGRVPREMDSRGPLFDGVNFVTPLVTGVDGKIIVRRRIGNISSFFKSFCVGSAISFLPPCTIPDAPREVLNNILRRSITSGSTRRADTMHEECDEGEERRKEEDHDKSYNRSGK